MKSISVQRLGARTPRQDRAKQKVELILEAAMRLLDKGGMTALTTNAVAETAGVSIGTLYQYFANKEAVLNALADTEMAELSQRVVTALEDTSATTPRERVARILRAVSSSYGQRRRVHRLIIDYSLSRGGRRLAPLIDRIIAMLASPDRHKGEPALEQAQAFVLANAVTGVIRAMILRPDDSSPASADIEEALVRLIVGFSLSSADAA